MIDGTAVKEIERLAKAGQEIQKVEVDGQTFTNIPLQDPRKPDPAPKPLTFHTLQGLVDYLEANRDDLELGAFLLHVVDPGSVQLVERLQGHFRQRFIYAEAEAPEPLAQSPLGFKFGAYLEVEKFNVALQALFADGWDKASVLQVIGNIRSGAEVKREDDGVTQQITVRAGVHLADTAVVPNPVTLAPFRTFPEIDQPASRFVLRVQQQGEDRVGAALHEADGDLWKVAAIAAIAEWLRPKVPAELVVVA